MAAGTRSYKGKEGKTGDRVKSNSRHTSKVSSSSSVNLSKFLDQNNLDINHMDRTVIN